MNGKAEPTSNGFVYDPLLSTGAYLPHMYEHHWACSRQYNERIKPQSPQGQDADQQREPEQQGCICGRQQQQPATTSRSSGPDLCHVPSACARPGSGSRAKPPEKPLLNGTLRRSSNTTHRKEPGNRANNSHKKQVPSTGSPSHFTLIRFDTDNEGEPSASIYEHTVSSTDEGSSNSYSDQEESYGFPRRRSTQFSTVIANKPSSTSTLKSVFEPAKQASAPGHNHNHNSAAKPSSSIYFPLNQSSAQSPPQHQQPLIPSCAKHATPKMATINSTSSHNGNHHQPKNKKNSKAASPQATSLVLMNNAARLKQTKTKTQTTAAATKQSAAGAQLATTKQQRQSGSATAAYVPQQANGRLPVSTAQSSSSSSESEADALHVEFGFDTTRPDVQLQPQPHPITRSKMSAKRKASQMSDKPPHYMTSSYGTDIPITRSLRRKYYLLIAWNLFLALTPVAVVVIYQYDNQNAQWARRDGAFAMSTTYEDMGFYPMGGVLTLCASCVFDVLAVTLISVATLLRFGYERNFARLLIINFFVTTTSAILLFANQAAAQQHLNNFFANSINRLYNENRPEATATKFVDTIQRLVRCCGLDNATDWQDSRMWLQHQLIPHTCCAYENIEQAGPCTPEHPLLNEIGCRDTQMQVYGQARNMAKIVAIAKLVIIVADIVTSALIFRERHDAVNRQEAEALAIQQSLRQQHQQQQAPFDYAINGGDRTSNGRLSSTAHDDNQLRYANMYDVELNQLINEPLNNESASEMGLGMPPPFPTNSSFSNNNNIQKSLSRSSIEHQPAQSTMERRANKVRWQSEQPTTTTTAMSSSGSSSQIGRKCFSSLDRDVVIHTPDQPPAMARQSQIL